MGEVPKDPGGSTSGPGADDRPFTFDLEPETPPPPAPALPDLGPDEPDDAGEPPRTQTRTRSRRVSDDGAPEPDISEVTVAERQGRAPAQTNDPLPRPPGWPREVFRWVLRSDVGANVIVVAGVLLVTDVIALIGFVGFSWFLQGLFVALFVLRGWITLVGQIAAGSDSARGYEKAQDIGRGAPSSAAGAAILAFAPAGLLLPMLVALWLLPREAGWLVASLTLAWSTTALLGWALHDRRMLWPHVALAWWVHRPGELAWATTGWIGLIFADELIYRMSAPSDTPLLVAIVATVLVRVASVAWLFIAARVLGVVGRSWTPQGYRPPPA
ncbi:MAG: hypothetical protein AB7T63_11780 [Planctomycetota bacterium]